MLPLNEQKQKDEQAHGISQQREANIPSHLLYYLAYYIWPLMSINTYDYLFPDDFGNQSSIKS